MKIKTEKDFWNLIEEARNEVDNLDNIDELLINKLSTMELEDLLYFHYYINHIKDKYYNPIISTIGIIMSDINFLSDDSFEYFRCWLIIQGESLYNKIFENPDYITEWILGNNLMNSY